MIRKIGLIIGNSHYTDSTLMRIKAPAADVEELTSVLQMEEIGGFDEVKALIDQPVQSLRLEIAKFFAEKKSSDLLFMYFSGHGVLDDQGQLYLAAKDTQHELLSGSAIPATFIAIEMERCRSRRQILVLDCCHSGAFGRGAKGVIGEKAVTRATFADPNDPATTDTSTSPDQTTSGEDSGTGRVIVTATDSTQYAWEGEKIIGGTEKSLFTHFLTHGLRTGQADKNRDGVVTVDELYEYIYENVKLVTPRQTPNKFAFRQQGDLIIAHNPLIARAGKSVAAIPSVPQSPETSLTGSFNTFLHRAKSDRNLVFFLTIGGVVLLFAIVALFLGPVFQERRLSAAAHGDTVTFNAGLALLGDARDTGARKQIEVDLPGFRLDKYEVSWGQYRLCVKAKECKGPQGGGILGNEGDKLFLNADQKWPVTYIVASDAAAFCRFVGGRLPSEAEWERAVHGSSDETRAWPWGDDYPSPERVNLSIDGFFNSEPENVVPVDGSDFSSGTSPNGVAHLIGNVAEWTSTPDACVDNPFKCTQLWDGKSEVGALFVRGMGFTDQLNPNDPEYSTTFAMPSSPVSFLSDLGFRCAYSNP